MQIYLTIVGLALFCSSIGWFLAWNYYNITSGQTISRLQGKLNQKQYEICRLESIINKENNDDKQ